MTRLAERDIIQEIEFFVKYDSEVPDAVLAAWLDSLSLEERLLMEEHLTGRVAHAVKRAETFLNLYREGQR